MFAAYRIAALLGVSALAVAVAQAQTAGPPEAGPTASPPAANALPPVTIDAPAVQRPRPRVATPRPTGPATTARARNTGRDAGLPSIGTPLDEITVTSTKTETTAIDALGGASVVSRDQLDAIQPSRISDILQQVPGVTTQESRNDPAQAINIRGLQDFGRVNVLVDGARQNFQSTGHGANGVFYLDPELVGGIDITRGPVSTIYGSGAIGGVVSFRTRGIDDILKPDEMAGVVQRIGAGTNGYGVVNSTSAGVRLPNNAATAFGQFVYRDNYVYRDGAGILIRDTDSELRSGNVKITANPAEGHQLTATALIQKFDFTNNGTSQTGSRFQSALDTDTYTLGYRFTPPDMPLIDLSIKGYYTSTYDLRTLLNPTTTYTQLGARPGRQISVDLRTSGFDIFNTSRFDTGPVSHAFTFGGDGVFDTVTTTDQAGGFTGAFTPSGRRDLTGAFIQDEMRFGGWLRAVGAVRYDSYSLSGGPFSSEGTRVSPRGTIGVSPFPWFEVFGTYAEGYRAPAISETLISGNHPFPAFQILPNTALRPETAHNLEGGINLKFDDVLRRGDAFRAKAVVFTNEVDDFINIQGVGPINYYAVTPSVALNALCAGRRAPFGPCQIPLQAQQYVNIARANLSGVEVEAAYDWGDGFASLAYSHTEGENAQTKVTLLTIPPDKVAGTVGLRFLDRRLTVGTRIVYNDARKNVPASTIIPNTKQYTLVDLFAAYDYSDAIRADVTLSNVFDVRYTKYLDLDRSPGFQARGALTFKFATR
ncbi:TonB-dependent hemoglobin/transferrin/lactoferrin family receptor [uncultured Enterovirga sp.]|uniref:TonB-dependent hemoglobin/transferrin/lactoferrin family receptor n=1 Tax=uncultured Enterovirga sp. TaxID=2026352 RepID=UPI0035C96829